MLALIMPLPSPEEKRGHSTGIKKESCSLPLLQAHSCKCALIFPPSSSVPGSAMMSSGATRSCRLKIVSLVILSANFNVSFSVPDFRRVALSRHTRRLFDGNIPKLDGPGTVAVRCLETSRSYRKTPCQELSQGALCGALSAPAGLRQLFLPMSQIIFIVPQIRRWWKGWVPRFACRILKNRVDGYWGGCTRGTSPLLVPVPSLRPL